MRKMGGLSKKIPITYVTMLIGSLAIAGIPPLAGFFSKDEILGESLKLGFVWVWAIGFVVAGLTAFYMFRLMGLTFWGDVPRPEGGLGQDPRVGPGHDHPAHPAGHPVDLPRACTSACRSARAGSATGWRRSSRRARRSSTPRPARGAAYALFGIDGVLIIASVDHRRHRRGPRLAPVRRRDRADPACRPGPERVRELTARAPFLYRASLNKWWFDDLNHLLFMVIGGTDRGGAVVVRPRGRRRHGQRARRGDRRRGARAPPGPDRPGPELRAGHRHRAHRHGRLVPAAGEGLMDVAGIPILSIVTFLPLIGALRHRLRAGRRSARPLALGDRAR